MPIWLPFEKDVVELEESLARLEATGAAEEVRRMRRDVANIKRKKYSTLSAWETVQLSRHPDRPQTLDYVELLCDEFVELHGDRAFGNDKALRTGFARIGDFKVMLVGHQKGRTLKERMECFYGCAHPEGYRKAMAKMKLAAKFHMPVVCLIDTPGAYPGIGAEERGQAQLIATSILEMARLPTPVVCVVIGEGGSGGALGIGVGDRVAMLEHAYYSVISPEGCAGILWKVADDQSKPRAAEALRMTSRDLLGFGVIDEVIPEPLGGAHHDPRGTAGTVKNCVVRWLRELRDLSAADLLDRRFQKFRAMGVFDESPREPVLNGVPVA